jgi:hypothetical protein
VWSSARECTGGIEEEGQLDATNKHKDNEEQGQHRKYNVSGTATRIVIIDIEIHTLLAIAALLGTVLITEAAK